VTTRRKTLIEDWFPIAVVSAETLRERAAFTALPENFVLHVWWARRPLTTSRAALLASVLPVWSEDWPSSLRERFPTRESYHDWFVKLCGVFGDSVAGQRLLRWAKANGTKLNQPPFSHKRAFKISPTQEYLSILGDLLQLGWGKRTLRVLDPFAGGGSIPFESLRYGFDTTANELNPVAGTILKATIDFPFRYGPSLVRDIESYGRRLAESVRSRLADYFPIRDGEKVHAYVWASTVKCPYTGKPIPLSPNWWLAKRGDQVAARPMFDSAQSTARFAMVRGSAIGSFNPSDGTVRGGHAVSPWAQNQPVDEEHIKAQARAGGLGSQLYAVAVKLPRGFEFREPRTDEIEAAERAASAMAKAAEQWRTAGLLPHEEIPDGNKTSEPRRYGLLAWSSLFTPRQLLAHCVYAEELRALRTALHDERSPEQAVAIETYLAIALDKALDYNSRLACWETDRQKIAHTFDRHDFAFSWSYAEFDAARNLYPWTIGQVVAAYKGMATLAGGEARLFADPGARLPVTISKGSAAHLINVPDRSVDHICTDPPYEANVMYAECSDFFYVWMKRTLGHLDPDMFRDELTNKDDEAVKNVARFTSMGRKKDQLALEDYERKMAAAFREMHRVLTDDGVLTVMFTHKKVEAWDTLATSLIGAGFAIHSSWPVHTESEHSLHQAKKNAAQSTILLTCRKREPRTEPVWWDDIKGNVRRAAREKAEEFERQGIRGVDLYIATFGPTLAILSENWPVLTSEVDERTGEAKPLRPEIALDLAREEVVALRKQGLLLGRSVTFDPFTDWYLMAWDAFMAQEFPGDEARKLALALGLDLEKQVIAEKKLVSKKGKTVTLQQPSARRKRGMVDPDQRTFTHWIDAAHTAMLLYKEDGSQACQHFLRETGFQNDSTFKALIQALLQAIPRTKQKGKFARPEAEVLDAMLLAFFDDLPVPPDEEVAIKNIVHDLPFDGASLAAEKLDDEGIEDDNEPDEDEEDDE
jgi:adenine-specific DNA methylase